MSVTPLHLGIALQRPDAVDTADRREHGEGFAGVSSMTHLAGRGLVLGSIMLGTLLSLTGRRSAAQRCGSTGSILAVRQGNAAVPVSGTYQDVPCLDRADCRVRQVEPHSCPPAKDDRRTITPHRLIDVHLTSLRRASRPRFSPPSDDGRTPPGTKPVPSRPHRSDTREAATQHPGAGTISNSGYLPSPGSQGLS